MVKGYGWCQRRNRDLRETQSRLNVMVVELRGGGRKTFNYRT